MRTYIYNVVELTDEYGGDEAYGVYHAYDHYMVSVWGDYDTAKAVADDLESGFAVA